MALGIFLAIPYRLVGIHLQNFVNHAWKLGTQLATNMWCQIKLRNSVWPVVACRANQSHSKVRSKTYHKTCSIVTRFEECCCYKLTRRWAVSGDSPTPTIWRKLLPSEPIEINALANPIWKQAHICIEFESELFKSKNDNNCYTVEHMHHIKWT